MKRRPVRPDSRALDRDLSKRVARRFEFLEVRLALSADAIEMLPLAAVTPQVTNKTPSGFTPAQIRHAYGFDQAVFAGGIAADGSGQTIAIVDAYNDPHVVADLQVFDQKFGLPAPPSFTVVNQTGGATLPKNSPSWSQEIALDVEWAHAMAPGASILLVEAKSANTNDLLNGVNYAKTQPGVSVVSMSWGSAEFVGEVALDTAFTSLPGQPVTFVAASGDNGSPAIWPAISPNVLSVGGTVLKTSDASGTYSSETGWNGSGGGVSVYEAKPLYQSGVVAGLKRANPDVAYDASPGSGFAIYDSVSYQFQSGWLKIGGTSAGAPQWSALLAIANQGRVLAGSQPLNGAQAAVYSLSSADFHDVTTGSNGGFTAGAGYDLVTGLGTPLANAVIADLVGAQSLATALHKAGSGTGGHETAVLARTGEDVSDASDAQLASGLAGAGAVGQAAPSIAPTQVVAIVNVQAPVVASTYSAVAANQPVSVITTSENGYGGHSSQSLEREVVEPGLPAAKGTQGSNRGGNTYSGIAVAATDLVLTGDRVAADAYFAADAVEIEAFDGLDAGTATPATNGEAQLVDETLADEGFSWLEALTGLAATLAMVRVLRRDSESHQQREPVELRA